MKNIEIAPCKMKTSMTDKRWNNLMEDDNLLLTKEEIESGWHFCPEMDGLLADSTDSRGDCFCELNKERMKRLKDECPDFNIVDFN